MSSIRRNSIAFKLCEVAIKILNNVYQSKLLWPIVLGLVAPLTEAMKINPAAKFVPDTGNMMIKLWSTFCEFIEKHLKGKLTSDQFTTLSYLINVALKSSNESIKKRTCKMWLSVFTEKSFSIPTSLHETLCALKLHPAVLPHSDLCSIEGETEKTKENIPSKYFSCSLINSFV